MSCSHKRREPICAWVWPRTKVKGRANAVSADTFELHHCPSCGAVGVHNYNEFVYERTPLRGSLQYSFERRPKR